MRLAVAVVNIVLGTAYVGYGVIAASEMARDWRSFGFSHFGAAWVCMAFTCGPHHLIHGFHVGFEGRPGGGLDLLSVVVGLPVGVVWLSLRVEAFVGGRGDRFLLGEPAWLRAVPALAAAYTTVLVAAALKITGVVGAGGPHLEALVVANIALVGVYQAIAWFVLRTQLRNHPLMSGWSVSGLCLTAIFFTCALMHGVWGIYGLAGTYRHDIHTAVIDWLSVPAALYFLWVVRRLYRHSLRDWNQGPGEVAPPASTPVAGFAGVAGPH